MQKLAASSNTAADADHDQLVELRRTVEKRLSRNSVWLVALRGFIENPTDVDLRANLEFILRRVASSDPGFLEEMDHSLVLRPPAVVEPQRTPSVQIDLKGSRNKVKDVAGRDINKNRTIRIGTAGLLALAVLGGGSYTVYRITHSGPALSSSRMSLPGISIAPPKGWTNFPASAPGQLTMAMAPSGTGSCPPGSSTGSPRCIEAVAISTVPSYIYSGNSPQQGLRGLANQRFDAVHASIRQATSLNQQAFTVNGCPAYKEEWHISWSQSPDTLEEWVVVKTLTGYQGTHLASVFIRLADPSNPSPQALIDAMTSSIQCS